MYGFFSLLFGNLLAYANGANDNFKGVATLFGSGTTDYRKALYWATITTALGSITALFIAQELLNAFSGKGLVSDELIRSPGFAISVAFAAGTTVMLATRIGFPISTTHALVGALVGVGFFGSELGVDFERLGTVFLIPLLLSPFIALSITAVLYPLLHYVRNKLGIRKQTCVCVGNEIVEVVPAGTDPQSALSAMVQQMPTVSIASEPVCRERYTSNMMGIKFDALVDKLHYLSSGMVCFARGLNDTPKIAAILIAGSAISQNAAILAVTAFMLIGGLVSARRVAETMSLKITGMDHSQGLTANIVTGFLVIVASKFGVPVSTTHVSSGSLFGLGLANGKAHWAMISKIVLAWIITLPAAALLGSIVLVFNLLE